MLLASRKDNIVREGQRVVMYEGVDSLYPVVLKKGGLLQCRLGDFPHEDIIGMPFGYRVRSSSRVGGWMTVLPLTPELWTRSLRTRTQIVFSTDAAFVAQQLELAPGCTVVESGTGSGALSSLFARCVAPQGHVHTFEYNQDRVEAAGEDFKANGLEGVVTLRHANVYDDGFGAHLDNKAHAVFLDLPAPWQAVHHARKALQLGGRIATFSPCIEQVQRTVQELRAGGFQDVRTFECLERRMMSRSMAVPVSELTALGQHVQGALSATKSLRKRRTRGAPGNGAGGDAEEKAGDADKEADAPSAHKRPRHAATGSAGEGGAAATTEPPSGEEGLAALIDRHTSKQKPKEVMWRSRPGIVMRAHTSFLTFATLRAKEPALATGAAAAEGAATPSGETE